MPRPPPFVSWDSFNLDRKGFPRSVFSSMKLKGPEFLSFTRSPACSQDCFPCWVTLGMSFKGLRNYLNSSLWSTPRFWCLMGHRAHVASSHFSLWLCVQLSRVHTPLSDHFHSDLTNFPLGESFETHFSHSKELPCPQIFCLFVLYWPVLSFEDGCHSGEDLGEDSGETIIRIYCVKNKYYSIIKD